MLSSLFLSFSFPRSILRPISSIHLAPCLPLLSLFPIISHNRETIRSSVLYVRDRGRLSGRSKVHVNVKIGYDRIYRFLLSRRSDSICWAIAWNYSFQSREQRSHWDVNDLYASLPVKTIDEFVVGLADQNPRDRSIVVALACLFRRNRDIDGTKFINCGMRMKSDLRIVSAGRRPTWSAFLFDAVPLIRRWTRERSYKGDATSRRQTSSRRYRNARKFLFGWFRLDIGELGRDDSEPNGHIASPIAYKMYQIFQAPYSHPFCLHVVRCAIFSLGRVTRTPLFIGVRTLTGFIGNATINLMYQEND